jgi:hypothetical protein
VALAAATVAALAMASYLVWLVVVVNEIGYAAKQLGQRADPVGHLAKAPSTHDVVTNEYGLLVVKVCGLIRPPGVVVALLAGGGGLLVDVGLAVEPVSGGQPHLGGLGPTLSGLGQADPALLVVG